MNVTLEEIKREAILRTFAECGGNRRRTAEALDISDRGLSRLLRAYRIPPGKPGRIPATPERPNP